MVVVAAVGLVVLALVANAVAVVVAVRSSGAPAGFGVRDLVRWKLLHRRFAELDRRRQLLDAAAAVSSTPVLDVTVTRHWWAPVVAVVLADGRKLRVMHLFDLATAERFVSSWRSEGRPPVMLSWRSGVWQLSAAHTRTTCAGLQLAVAGRRS